MTVWRYLRKLHEKQGLLRRRAAGRTERRARRFSRRLGGILVSDKGLYEEENVEEMEVNLANNVDEMEADQSDQEGEEEEDETPFKSRLRSSRATDQVATSAEGPEDSSSTAHSSASIPENKFVAETPEEERKETEDNDAREEAGADDEGRYRRERKRKGKQPTKQVRKKARKANPTVTIQEPIQVPFGRQSSEEEMSEEEETSSGELYSASKEEQNPEDAVSLMSETEVVEKVTYERIFVDLDDGLQEEMGKFEDAGLQKVFNKKMSGSKDVKSGKVIHLPSLREVATKGTFHAYLEQIGFE